MGGTGGRSPYCKRLGREGSIRGSTKVGRGQATDRPGGSSRGSAVWWLVAVAHPLVFERLHSYGDDALDIVIPICLRVGTSQQDLLAKLDTGASRCIFQRQYGEALGLDIETGIEQSFRTALNERFTTYGHSVTLEVLDYTFDTTVCFAKDYQFKRNAHLADEAGWSWSGWHSSITIASCI
jgi:hypothetical protein